MKWPWLCVTCGIWLGLTAGTARPDVADPATGQPPQDLTELSLSDLAEIEVTTISKKPENRSRVVAAVHVITQEDIRRSGATSLPEVLRLAPGARSLASIPTSGRSAYGASPAGLSRSMLVLMDGRSVYTLLFAGVYWDLQDALLEDVDRIEVIRGPGGTLWGANAVNGVVNVITKSARDTQGQQAGHRVEAVGSGTAALQKLGGGHYDLILTDIRMPELDGPDLYREVQRRHPGTEKRFVFLTGDTPAPGTLEFLKGSGRPHIAKPFQVEQVLRAASQALGEPAAIPPGAGRQA